MPVDIMQNLYKELFETLDAINLKRELHPELFGINDNGEITANTKSNSLQNVGRSYKPRFSQSPCKHKETMTVDLGYNFITDMLVLKFILYNKKINTRSSNENLWLPRAAQSLAEAFRLVACKELDIDFSELVTGYRIRRANDEHKTFVDIYIYYSLSSGADYSIKIENLSMQMKNLMTSCDCETACDNCLKRYRNQFIHGKLDRFYGLDLLENGVFQEKFQKKFR